MTTPLVPARLRCAHQVNPLGVSPDRVRLSWQVRGEGSGRLQRAYQILLMRDGAVAWDSARVDSSSSTDIGYAGPALAAGGRYLWKVRIWDESGSVSGWSDPAVFEVELDRTDGWHAFWIGLGRIRENVSPPTGAPDPVIAWCRREGRTNHATARLRGHARCRQSKCAAAARQAGEELPGDVGGRAAAEGGKNARTLLASGSRPVLALSVHLPLVARTGYWDLSSIAAPPARE